MPGKVFFNLMNNPGCVPSAVMVMFFIFLQKPIVSLVAHCWAIVWRFMFHVALIIVSKDQVDSAMFLGKSARSQR